METGWKSIEAIVSVILSRSLFKFASLARFRRLRFLEGLLSSSS